MIQLKVCCVEGKNLNPQDGSPNFSDTTGIYASQKYWQPGDYFYGHVLIGRITHNAKD